MRLTEAAKLQVKQEALKRAKDLNLERSANLYIHDEVLPAGDRHGAAALGLPIERDSALVFVDLAPTHNWAHPCEYHLHDAQTSELYQVAKASLPPSILTPDREAVTAFHSPVRMIDTRERRATWRRRIPPITNAPSAFPGERYAILFTGKAENRHTNDMEFLYRTLIDVYGFDAANIQVCNHDGTLNYFLGPSTSQTVGENLGNWPGNSTAYRMVVNHAGTRAGMQAAFNAIAAQIRPEDLLFIHTNNHGGGVGDHGRDADGLFDLADFCLYAYHAQGSYWIPYYVNDFITDMGVLPQCEVLMVMMEQCRSGGFINPIVNHSPADWTHVATAVEADDYSDGGLNFDPFAEDWIAAMNGQYPDGTGLHRVVDANGDARISAVEAFNYADAEVTGGDTPDSSDKPTGYGAYMFLGLPAHDLYLRDNLLDHGREPLIGGGISCSPDIIVYNQELLDPEATLGSASAQQDDTLGQNVEAGQNNYIYLRIQNRGTQVTSGTAKVYWTEASTLPTPSSWHPIGSPVPIPAVNPGEMKIVSLTWAAADIPGEGHYCFIGLIESGDDPAPDPSTIHTVDDYYAFIRESNNATWKNFNVRDLFKNASNKMQFQIQGWPRVSIVTDLAIDLTQLPESMEIKLKILKRLSAPATPEHMALLEESELYQHYALQAGQAAALRNIHLNPSDSTKATLEFLVPQDVADGNYRLSAAQIVGGREMGRVTHMLAVGEYPFMGNSRSREIHYANCAWAGMMAPRHKVAYHTVEQALKHGFNGCRFCLPEHDTD